MANIRERYEPSFVAVNTTIDLLNHSIGGFLCKTDGTITVINARGSTVVSAHPVTAGTYVPLPMVIGGDGSSFTTAGGASGTLLA